MFYFVNTAGSVATMPQAIAQSCHLYRNPPVSWQGGNEGKPASSPHKLLLLSFGSVRIVVAVLIAGRVGALAPVSIQSPDRLLCGKIYGSFLCASFSMDRRQSVMEFG